MATKSFDKAKRNKADEFYTQWSDIEKEIQAYLEFNPNVFKDKTVLCPCDDPYESNFFKYFALHFNDLGLKKLIATCYIGSPIASMQLTLFSAEPEDDKTTRTPHKIEITEVADYNADGAVDLSDVKWLLANKKNALTRLVGDGDFRSEEIKALRDKADFVITNPPFSLFREYVAQLMDYKKEFLIIGNQNAVTYREIFPLIRDNRIWLGYNCGHFWFMVPDSYEEKQTDFKIDENGQKWRRMGNICWFTNLDIEKRHENMTLFRKFSPDIYPKYDNYNAVEVSKTADIPCDYYGIMGVPITFMQYYNPEQFRIVGVTANGLVPDELKVKGFKIYNNPIIKGEPKYQRVIIERIGA